ncbi:MAG TPA: phosphorylase [Coleofasciculaceae cyanobacterium]
MNQPHPLIQAILVPQGAEYQSVRRGLSRANATVPVVPIPVGLLPLSKSLETWQQTWQFDSPQPQILLMGLCGSLSADHAIGDVVTYQSCIQEGKESQACAAELTETLHQVLKVDRVKALTTDRVIHTASEKHQLSQRWGAAVVDMEGAIVLQSLNPAGISVAMLRVVSDDCHHNIPNLNPAFRADGSLNSMTLAAQFLKEPIAATRLMRGAIRGLQTLQSVTTHLFTELGTNASHS